MLLLDSSVCGLFKWRQFEPEVILLAVGWYLRFSLSYRDVEELLAERDHALLLTMYNSGGRVSEITGLSWQQIALRHNYVSGSQRQGTQGAKRTPMAQNR